MIGKGSASNPGSISDIHSLETQELSSLLKDASKADTPPTAVPESPTGSPVTADYSSPSQGQLQDHTQSSTQQQKIQSAPQTAPSPKPASTQAAQQLITGAQHLINRRATARNSRATTFYRRSTKRTTGLCAHV